MSMLPNTLDIPDNQFVEVKIRYKRSDILDLLFSNELEKVSFAFRKRVYVKLLKCDVISLLSEVPDSDLDCVVSTLNEQGCIQDTEYVSRAEELNPETGTSSLTKKSALKFIKKCLKLNTPDKKHMALMTAYHNVSYEKARDFYKLHFHENFDALFLKNKKLIADRFKEVYFKHKKPVSISVESYEKIQHNPHFTLYNML